ncbi:hypothetical protein OUZ56_012602 [Daphnia magna]|uniref:Uncharacterized protein n=1 Tax=Daphnia magna TaxID=35525 RepID=A0ABQ9Z3P8_9CRUS|nr:hypothetical protein OUZ56_012602 [Daphnia magna]
MYSTSDLDICRTSDGLHCVMFPVHRSKAVMTFVVEHEGKIVILDWPKSFGDVMPVQTVWLKMITKFTHENVMATRKEDKPKQSWLKFEPQHFGPSISKIK